jgi:hypothetical protein
MMYHGPKTVVTRWVGGERDNDHLVESTVTFANYKYEGGILHVLYEGAGRLTYLVNSVSVLLYEGEWKKN